MDGEVGRSKGDLVAVVGTTGVGKSQLAIELAKAVSTLQLPHIATQGEVINSDSMQVYKGLDIITNKVTQEEMLGVPHHLMGFLQPGQEYKIGDFQRDAIQKINELQDESKLPIVVGGTTYYVQHLIFPNSLVSDAPSDLPPPSTPPSHLPESSETSDPSSLPAIEPRPISSISNFPESLRSSIMSLPGDLFALFFLHPSLPLTSSPSEFPPLFPVSTLPPPFRTPESLAAALYAMLTHVDPRSAARWHWRDIRKVRRAIDIVWEGRRWQDVLDFQANNSDRGARFRTLVFWLYAEPSVLNERLDKRVDQMIDLGLMEEIEGMWDASLDASGKGPVDYSRGVYQSIGYKEFEPYLRSTRSNGTHEVHSTADPTTRAQNPLFKNGLDSMKLSTRQYAKKQVKWIKQKLVPAAKSTSSGDVHVYLLDATDLSTWNENVRDRGVDLLRIFLSGGTLPDPASVSETAATLLQPMAEKSKNIKKIACESCSEDPSRPFLVEERGWDAHLISKTHRARLRRATPLEERIPYLKEKAERDKVAKVDSSRP
ncbi:tRNA isopentenyltransferase [Meredithblackwellia eburnea MCA 4105]